MVFAHGVKSATADRSVSSELDGAVRVFSKTANKVDGNKNDDDNKNDIGK